MLRVRESEVAVTELREHFDNPEEGKRPLFEANQARANGNVTVDTGVCDSDL
jgi:hypothetical protein